MTDKNPKKDFTNIIVSRPQNISFSEFIEMNTREKELVIQSNIKNIENN